MTTPVGEGVIPATRWYMLPAVVVVGGFVTIVLMTNVFRPAPADVRLAGVSVAIARYTIDELPDDAHRLNLRVTVTSATDLDECVAFTLDQPFAGRRLQPLSAMPTAQSR